MNATVLIAFIVGLSGTIITIFGNVINKRQENNQAIRLAILESAFKEYEFRNEILKEMRADGRATVNYPWDYYILCYGKILKVIEKNRYSDKDIEKMFTDLDKIKSVYDNRNKIPAHLQ